MISIRTFETSAELAFVSGEEFRANDSVPMKLAKFTPEEMQVIRMLSDGKNRKEIAGAMKWSISKLRYVLIGIRAVARVRNDIELVAYATRKGLV